MTSDAIRRQAREILVDLPSSSIVRQLATLLVNDVKKACSPPEGALNDIYAAAVIRMNALVKDVKKEKEAEAVAAMRYQRDRVESKLIAIKDQIDSLPWGNFGAD